MCYHTTGPEGWYVRKNQIDYVELCRNAGDMCYTQWNADLTVTRGCGTAKARSVSRIVCKGNLCNTKPATRYCFTCLRSDPNCVFSQLNGPFELCPLATTSCYTRIFRDNSVERGCSVVNMTIEDSECITCDDRNLCNGETTKHHSCHMLQLNVDFKPLTWVPDAYWKWPTEQGWMFESCPDVEGLPACYAMVSFRRLRYGCTSDLAMYGLLAYKTGSIIEDMNFCDGHYCNFLPYVKHDRRMAALAGK